MVPSCAAGAPRWAGWHVRLLLAAAAALPRLSASVCLRPPFERLRGPSKSAYGRAWARWTRAGPDRRSWPVGLGARGMSDAAASPRMTSLCPAGGRRRRPVAACKSAGEVFVKIRRGGLMFALGLACMIATPCSASLPTFDINGPAGSATFGRAVYVLRNGNIVVSTPTTRRHRHQRSGLSTSTDRQEHELRR
jgi:hypothetical protein